MYQPSRVAAACVMAARKICKITPLWSKSLEALTGYGHSEVTPAEILLDNLKTYERELPWLAKCEVPGEDVCEASFQTPTKKAQAVDNKSFFKHKDSKTKLSESHIHKFRTRALNKSVIAKPLVSKHSTSSFAKTRFLVDSNSKLHSSGKKFTDRKSTRKTFNK